MCYVIVGYAIVHRNWFHFPYFRYIGPCKFLHKVSSFITASLFGEIQSCMRNLDVGCLSRIHTSLAGVEPMWLGFSLLSSVR